MHRILEKLPFFIRVSVQHLQRVTAETREKRHVLGTNKNVYGVDLDDVQTTRDAFEIVQPNLAGFWPRFRQSCRNDRDAARLVDAECPQIIGHGTFQSGSRCGK